MCDSVVGATACRMTLTPFRTPHAMLASLQCVTIGASSSTAAIVHQQRPRVYRSRAHRELITKDQKQHLLLLLLKLG